MSNSISEMRSRKTSRKKKKEYEELEKSMMMVNTSMSLDKRLTMFFNENADKYFVPFLDKTDMIKLQMSKLLPNNCKKYPKLKFYLFDFHVSNHCFYL